MTTEELKALAEKTYKQVDELANNAYFIKARESILSALREVQRRTREETLRKAAKRLDDKCLDCMCYFAVEQMIEEEE